MAEKCNERDAIISSPIVAVNAPTHWSKVVNPLYKGMRLFRISHSSEAFYTTRTLLKAVFWSLVSTQIIIKQNILTCWSSVRLLLKWMKTLLLISTWARPQASNRTLLMEVLLCEVEATRIFQINPDNNPSQTLAEIIPAWKIHGQCLSGLRSLLHNDALCAFI